MFLSDLQVILFSRSIIPFNSFLNIKFFRLQFLCGYFDPWTQTIQFHHAKWITVFLCDVTAAESCPTSVPTVCPIILPLALTAGLVIRQDELRTKGPITVASMGQAHGSETSAWLPRTEYAIKLRSVLAASQSTLTVNSPVWPWDPVFKRHGMKNAHQAHTVSITTA